MIYSHTFKDGSVITLRVDFSGPLPRMTATPYKPGNRNEYLLWRDTVVAPDVLARMTIEQTEATVAMQMAKGGWDRTPEGAA